MSIHLDNVTMQQSTGLKSNMPNARPAAELLLALNEFNRYELFTGTGDGVQPLIADGSGTSNVSFTTNQDTAPELNGKFVYFDSTTNTWKPAYAQADPNQTEHYTAQGFAVSLNSTGIQVTTSGKLEIPFQLKDINNNPVAAGSYYYLCQDPSNAGNIQQNAPTTGIMQIVCQIMSVSETSTTLLLLNDLSQVAEDVIVTSGDGSKYLGDDGQYHPMLIAGLAGRTSNCIEAYEVLDTNFNNIAAGRTTAQDYEFPSLTADLGWPGTGDYAFATGWSADGTEESYNADVTSWYTITSGKDIVSGTYSGEEGGNAILDLKWKFPQETFIETITNINNTTAANAEQIWKTCLLSYSDDGVTWTSTQQTITNPNNTSGSTSTISFDVETYKSWGAHTYWKLSEFTAYNDNYNAQVAFNKIVLAGEYYVTNNPNSYGYIPSGDIQINENIATGFSESNYIISKYLVQGNTQYSFRVCQSFTQVEQLEPIWSAPNLTNYMAIEQGLLKLVLNNNVYKGNLTYEPDKYYHFRLTYNRETGYVVSSSEDGDSWTNEIAVFDELNYLDGITLYLGIIHIADSTTTTGSIDLSNSGFDYLDGEKVIWNYPLSDLTNKDISTITVTFKGTGLVAQGRAADTATVLSRADNIDTVNNTIIASDNTDLIWDVKNGLVTRNYTEVDYLRQFESAEEGTVLYAKDTNKCYTFTVVYPNFLQTNVLFEKPTTTELYNVTLSSGVTNDEGVLSTFGTNDRADIDYLFAPVATDTWEFYTKVTTGPSLVTTRLIGCSAYLVSGFVLGQGTTTGTLSLWASSTANSWNVAQNIPSTEVLDVNTDYLIRVTFDGLQYKVDVTTNTDLTVEPSAKTWTNYITVDSSIPIAPFYPSLGNHSAIPWTGSIDLNGCYLIVNGKKVWEGVTPSTNTGDSIIDLSPANSTFHPNKFLNRNGFNFNLKLDLTGSLKLTRKLDARNYGSTQAHPFYIGVQGVDWSTFVNEGNYTQGIKISNPLGSTNTGTASGALYNLTTAANSYANTTYGASATEKAGIGWVHFNFEKPIRFHNLLFLNWESANYIPNYFCMHVSNDMNTWYSIMPEETTGYVENGMFRNIPIDAYAAYSNRTVKVYWNQQVKMPDEHTYWKYVRFGFWGPDAYRPICCGLWIGAIGAAASTTAPDFTKVQQTAEELIWEDKDFINGETSGIHGSVVKKQIGTAYQVKFLDELGWVTESPDNGVTDVTGKQLVSNNLPIYSDTRLQNQKAQQRLAYQTHCKQYLRGDRSYSYSSANNPFIYSNGNAEYCGCANVGTVANSYNLLQLGTTSYDFANGLLENAFVITFKNKARVGYFYMQNHTTVAYSPQTVKVYGAVTGGNEPGTTATNTTGDALPDAEWEEIPIYNIINLYDATNPNYSYYEPNQEQNTFVDTANCTNHQVYSATATTYTGGYNVYIAPTKAYQQYKIVVQRTVNNRVIGGCIIPRDVQFDPWATNLEEDGVTNKPLLADRTFYPSSSATVLPLIKGNTQAIYSSPYSATTLWQVYSGDNNACWTPGNDLKYVYLQQAFPYAVAMNSIQIQSDTAMSYAANQFMYFGTNNDDYATVALSNTNPLGNWHRITSLKDKVDVPTVLNTANKYNTLVFGRKEYGYNYFTALFARTLGASVYIDYFNPDVVTTGSIINNTYTNPSIYTEEWKWTNVAGEQGEIRNATCYNHPELAVGETTLLKPSYVVTKRGDETKYYTPTEAPAAANLPDGTAVFRTTSMVGNLTVPYENRWMYKFTDLEGNTWYSNTAATGTDATLGAYMYQNVVPKYNSYYVTGIPLDATANEGSANGFTYFSSTQYAAAQAAYIGFQNPLYDAETWVSVNGSYTAATGLPTGDPAYVGFISPEPICVQGYTIGGRVTSASTPAKWRFEGSNDGQEWELIDARSSRNLTYIQLPTFTANTTGDYTVEDSRGNTDAYTIINGVTSKSISSWATYWFQITYNEEVKMDSYTLRADNNGSPEYPSAWELQGLTTDGNWVTLDEREGVVFTLNETKKFQIQPYTGSYATYRLKFNAGAQTSAGDGELGKIGFNAYPASYAGTLDVPVNPAAGTSYYFDNEKSYTHYRWVIEQNELGGQAYTRLKVWGLFVLEENPFEVKPIYELSYTNSNGDLLYAYTSTQGVSDEYIGNNIIIYKDVKWSSPETNVWAYEVTDNTDNFWVITPGEAGGYVPEGDMIYKDFDFQVEDEAALVDTWMYTGNINKKFSYTGEQIQDFTWDEQEPYNKYVYTGEVANQFKYTGKIEGWTYTGVSEPIYDVVPNFKLTLNREDVRQIEKKTILGMAYPVTTVAEPAGTSFYSFTSSDVAGTIVPAGTLLYTDLNSTEPSATADGTDTFVYSSAPAQTRSTTTYLYTANNTLPDGTNLLGTEQAYYDANLTQPVDNAQVDLTQYAYTGNRQTSHMKDFYHPISEETPAESYNFGLSFDGSGYTFSCYQDNGSTDIQTFESGELLRSSYSGTDAQVKNNVVIIMKQQDIIKLNLSKSEYSWWTWNNILDKTSQQNETELFRLAKINGGSAWVDDIYNLYPWRVEDSSKPSTDIGDPIITLNNVLKPNEIWLEGQLLKIHQYWKLFQVYGTTYGGDGVKTFGVPDFRGRAIWGSEDRSFGYIEAGLPNITGVFHTGRSANAPQGAFSKGAQSGSYSNSGGASDGGWYSFNASWSNVIYGNSTTVQPPSVKARIKTRFI